MIVSISAMEFDLQGVLVFRPLPDSSESEYTRRFNRVATLDGGVVVNDGGFSHGDRDITFRLKASPAQDATLRRLVRLYSRVRVSFKQGIYSAVIAYAPAPGISQITLSLTASLTEG